MDLESGEGAKWSAPWGRRWDDLSVDEMGNRLLTNLSFYEEELAGVGWLLVWHSDAILCANAERDLEEWVGWDWVGAPWWVLLSFLWFCDGVADCCDVGLEVVGLVAMED